MSEITLGTRVADSITGFTGTSTSRIEYLEGSPQIEVEASVKEGGEPIKSQWFEEARLHVQD